MTTTSDTEAAAPAGPAPRPLPGRMRYALCVITAAIVLLLDQATKLIAVETLEPFQPVDSAVPLVQWQLLTNENAAFGIPGLFTGMFVVVTLVVVALIARALPRTDRLSMALAYGLVVGGALGNVTDRLLREGTPDGAVVDFISVGFWPTFNLADTAIVTGAALLVVLLLRADREARHREQAAAARQSVRPDTVPPQGNQTAAAPAGEGGEPGQADGSDGATGGDEPDAAASDTEEVAADERR